MKELSMNKLSLLKLGFLALLIFALALPGYSKSIKFVQISDIHYSSDSNASSSRDVSQSAVNLRFAVQSIMKQDVDFVMFLGDSTDKSDPHEIISFLRCVQKIKKPFYFVIGNHDAHKLAGIDKESYIKLINIYDPYQKSKKPYYYFKPSKDVLAVVMDGASDFAPTAHGNYSKEMVTWLDKILEKNKDKVVLIFQHFPLIAPTDNYSHTTLEIDPYMELLCKYKNIALISSGHFHADKVVVDENGIHHISVPALLNKPSIYEVVNVNYSKKHFTPPTEVKVEISRIKL